MQNTDLFLKRYHNQININGFGVPGQEALGKSKILAVGFSGLTSPMLMYLASAGVGTIGIVSNEKLRQEDLPSHPIFNSTYEGKLKGQSAAIRLREINPDLKIVLYEEELTADNILSFLGGYNLVVDTGHDLPTSLLLNDACVMLDIPMVYGALFHPSGHYAVFNYKSGATFRCMLANQRALDLGKQEKNYTFGSLAGIIGGFLANEVIKIVGELGEVASNRLVILNSYTSKLDYVRIDPVPENRTISTFREDYHRVYTSAVPDPSSVRSISAKLLGLKMKYKESIQLVDIREEQHREGKEVWNFLHIPESEFFKRKDEIHQDIMVVLISSDGESARQMTGLLNSKFGFDNIYYLQGGLQDWIKETNTQGLAYESF